MIILSRFYVYSLEPKDELWLTKVATYDKEKLLAHHIGLGHKITFVPNSIEGIGFKGFFQ